MMVSSLTSLFVSHVLAGPASRVSPRRARYFSLLRQSKVPQKKASRIRQPFASLQAHCVARGNRGLAKLGYRLGQRQSLSGCPCATRLLITALDTKYKNPRGRAMARPWLAVGVPVVLSSRRLAGLSSARNRAAALTSARLLFGNFLLAKQEKVTAPSGAHPDTPAPRGHRQVHKSPAGARPGSAAPHGNRQTKKAHLEARPEAKEA